MTQPRYAEFAWLKHLTEKWVEWEKVDGNDPQQEFYDGGLIDG